MKPAIKLICLLPLAAALPAGAEELTRLTLCPAAEDLQMLYYYLDPGMDAALKERKTACPGLDTVYKMPGWLEKARPAMEARKVWKDPEEGELSEAKLWQAPISILYEFAEKTRTTLPGPAKETPASPFMMEKDYNGIRVRFMLSLERIARSRLYESLEGRGRGMFSTLSRIMERMDGLTKAIAEKDKDGFDTNANEALDLSRDLFAQLSEEPRIEPVYRYRPEARILDGYRGVSLPVPGYQTFFLTAGERVDLLVTFEAITGKGVKDVVTATILQNVVVLQVAQPASPDGKGVIQLLCNPNEAQYAMLSLAQCKSINIARRAAGDVELHPMEIASLVKLFK